MVMLWWSRNVVRGRWLILGVAAAVAMVSISWGSGVFGSLTSGGFDDPGSESARAMNAINAELGQQDVDVVVIYSDEDATVDQPELRSPVVRTLVALRRLPEVARVVSYYDTHLPGLVSEDRHATYAAITFAAVDEDGKMAAYEHVRPALDAPGVTTQVGGVVAFQATADEQVERDLARGEMLAMPVVLILMVFIFGGLVAATMPLLVGVMAILGALTITRLITTVTDVSVFAVNTIVLLGLGMAIDYSLLIVSRFREELASGAQSGRAIARTMDTAGRTVLISGLTIASALASLLIFPQAFLRSMGMGGIAAVVVAMLGALIVLPAMLAVLGPRINALRVPLPWHRRRTGTPEATIEHGAWARLARSVMLRPLPYLAVVAGLLTVLTLPFLHAQFSGADERVLPKGTEARVVAERLVADFPGGSAAPIETFIDGASPVQVHSVVGRIEALPGVTDAAQATARGGSALVRVSYAGQRTGEQAHDVVRAIRDLPVPAGSHVLVGGRTAADMDRLDSLSDRLPWMVLLMAAVTLVLLFFAFGSVLLPVKAVLMNAVSIGASFGVLVWVFQDGHLAEWLGFTPTGFLEPSIPILVLAILFGLATDYEIFLLSRIREAWEKTGDNTAAVAAGMQATGPIITAAALLLGVVVTGFTTGEITLTKMIGVGIIVAIAVDATLIRMVLVPATMRLLGRWNWWAPGPLAAAYRRFGFREPGAPAERTDQVSSRTPDSVRVSSR